MCIYCEMITITLVNIYPLTKLQEFFPPLKTAFTAYFVSCLRIYNSVVSYSHQAAYYILRVYSSFNWKFASFDLLYPFSLSLTSVNY